jgi:hypothetical protein
MQEKKRLVFKSPDITQMQEVVINYKTRIYIAIGADPEEARSRHLNRPALKGKSIFVRKKPDLAVVVSDSPQTPPVAVLNSDQVLKIN